MQPRQLAPAVLVVALTVAGFFGARGLGAQDARRDSEHRAAVAAAQIRGRVEQGVSVAESLRRSMLGVAGNQEFESNASRWLSPAGFPAAAWVEQVPASRRAAYERRTGHPIVTRDRRGRIARAGSRASYLAATLASGIPPMAVPGIDLGGEAGVPAALARASTLYDAGATPLTTLRDGTKGVFLMKAAPRLVGGLVEPGFAVVFVSELSLRAAASATATLQLTAGGGSTADRQGGATVRRSFVAAGQRFDVVVPRGSVAGTAVVLPWIILAAGLVLAALAWALGVNAARRARAQDELDRIFTLSSDLITVADFDGHFTRVNPAAEQILGYTKEELLARPYLELVHPDDREKTGAEATAIAEGKTTLSFENRFVRKDGSYRVLEWTSTPATEDRVMYGVARDVTERRQADAELERLAGEQTALRRVATLVAEDVPSSELFHAVAREVGTLLGADFSGMIRYEDDSTVAAVATWAAVGEHPPVPDGWPIEEDDAATMIAETRQSARVDDWAAVPGLMAAFIREELGVNSSVGSPIVVEGRLWGALAVHSKQRTPVPADTESRLQNFTELVATAIANTDARADVARLAREQAALRRVAELVAREASQAEVFSAIAEELAQLLGTEEMRMLRYESDGDAVIVASAGDPDIFPVGSRWPLEGENVASLVFRTGRSARIDDYGPASGAIAEVVLSSGIRCAVAAPVVVEGRLWGAMVTSNRKDEPLPPDTESRLGQFTELMATAIANAEAHAEVERLAEEQAALRRVATLVAEEPSLAEVFAKVADEAANALGDIDCALWRDEGDGTASAVTARGVKVSAGFPAGTRLSVDGDGVVALVLREGRPRRIDDYSAVSGAIAERAREIGIRSTVGCPIVVGGRTWGVMAVARYKPEPFPLETETRIAQFSHLVATAIANTEARAEVERLAEEQAALRRVATLVAQGAPPSEVLDAVAAEMERVLGADGVTLSHYEPNEAVVVVAHSGSDPRRVPPGTRVSHQGENVTSWVRRSARSARMEHRGGTQGAIAELVRTSGVRASVGAPIIVDGRLWGVAIANWRGEQSPPADTEERMAQFAELLDTAIANADSRGQLTASRARLVTEGDEARRRLARDLHDGAQQRLVYTTLTLKLAQQALQEDNGEAESLVGEALEQAEQANVELRELAHGILPAVLTHGGLRAGVRAVVSRLDLPVQVVIPDQRFPAETEASAYFIVAEALTNVVKHAHAGSAEVRAFVEEEMLHVEVRDDGSGGADPGGHGLVGMGDRVTALGGQLKIESPAGGPTLVAATLPLSDDADLAQ